MKSQSNKNINNGFSKEKIKSYLNGEMDSAQMYEFERNLEENSFMAAAMEGYKKHPESLNNLDNIKSKFNKKLNSNTKSFWEQHGIKLSVAAIVAVISISIIFTQYLQPVSQQISENIEINIDDNLPEIKNNVLQKTETEEIETTTKSEEILDEVKPEIKKNTPKRKTETQNQNQKKETTIIIEEESKSEILEDSQTIEKNETVNKKNITHSIYKKNKTKASTKKIQERKTTPPTANLHVTAKNEPKRYYDKRITKSNKNRTKSESLVFSEDAPEPSISKNEGNTKIIYLFELKVIDYTKVYEQQIIRTKTVYNPGLDAKYSNISDKFAKKKFEDQILDSVTYVDVLQVCLGYYKNGAYEKSLDNFAIILRKHPEELNAKFYGALANFDLGNYKKAIRNFDFVIEHPISVFNPESEWYKAQCLVGLGKTKKAKNQLEKIILNNGFYSSQAKLLLTQIQK